MRFNGTLPCHTRISFPTLGILESDVSNCITVEVNRFEYFIMAIIAVLIKVPVSYVYTLELLSEWNDKKSVVKVNTKIPEWTRILMTEGFCGFKIALNKETDVSFLS